MGDQVECRSDFDYAQRPVAFTWQGTRIEITEVITRDRNPSGLTFLVRTADFGIFELTYDNLTDQWSVRQN